MTAATATAIQYMNLAYFGRPADPASLGAWPSSGLSQEEIVLEFVKTAEYVSNTVTPNSSAAVGGGRTFNDTTLVNTFYQRLFGRLAASGEVAGWANALASGAVNYDYLGITILNAALAFNGGSAAEQAMYDIVEAKFDSAQLYTGILFNDPVSANAYSTSTAINDGIAFNDATTTATPQTFAQAQTAVTNMVSDSGATSGVTFELTRNADTATAQTFTSNVDIVGNFALNTLNNGDRLTGSGTAASLNATLNTSGGFNITPALLSNIATATFDITNIGAAGAASTLGLANSTGLTTLSSGNAGQVVTYANMGTALTTLNVTNTAQQTVTSFTDAALAGTTDTFNINLTGVTGNVDFGVATANASGYETLQVASNGSAVNTSNFTLGAGAGAASAGYTTLNVTGAAGLTTVNQSAALTTFNSSTNTGNVTYTQGGEAAATYTFGTGNDTLNLAGTYSTADTIDMGEGTNLLTMNAANVIAATTVQTNVSNVGRIRIATDNGAGGTYSVGNFGADHISLGATQTVGLQTFNFLTGGGTLDLRTNELDAAATIVVAGTGTTDAVALNTSNAAADDVVGAALNANGVEILNITNSGGAAQTFENVITLAPSVGGSSRVNIAGNGQVIVEGAFTSAIINASTMTAGGLLMDTNGAAAAGTTTVNAIAGGSNVTGSGFADRLGGSAGNDTIVGGAGADVINGNGGVDAITLGGGFDTANFNANATAGTALLNAGNSYNTVNEFTVGSTAATTDLIALSADATYGSAAIETMAGVDVAAGNAAIIITAARNAATVGAASTANIIKVTNTDLDTTGLTGDTGWDGAIGTGSITTAGAGTMLAMYYDATNTNAVLGTVVTGAANISAADTFAVITRIDMSATDYATFDATNFAAFANNAAL